MRFYNYLNETYKEDMTIDEINSLIHKDCKYYMDLIQNKWPFSRGLQTITDVFGIKNVRQNRRPRGTTKEYYDDFNKWLQNNGHVRRDKAIMAISSKGLERKIENLFGSLYYIFPIGKFNYTWLKSRDLNYSYAETGWHSDSIDDFFGDGYDSTFEGFETYFITNKGIEIAWKNKYEIWFDCKRYYYFSHENFEYTWKSNKLILKEKKRS